MAENKNIIKNDTEIYGNGLGSTAEYTGAKVEEDFALIAELDRCLSSVIGQDYAVQAVKEYLFGINGRRNERGVGGLLTFMGPPAVGKTYMAELIAKATHRPFLRFDMSSYNDHEASLCDMFGINRSYKSARTGQLTQFVLENPVCVLLLDEIEKAHPNVQARFLQILERGDAQDLYTEKFVSFRDVLLIVTTNVGRSVYDRTLTTYHFAQTPQATLIHALRTEKDPQSQMPYFSDALVSRLTSGRIILFNKLRPEVLHRITAEEAERRVGFYQDRYGVTFGVDPLLLAKFLILSLGAKADIRTALKSVKEFFERSIERLVKLRHETGAAYFTKAAVRFDFSDMTDRAEEMFRHSEKMRVLVCCGEDRKELFSGYASEGTEILFDDGKSAAELCRMDLSCAILDRDKEEEHYGGELFSSLIALEEVPVYVYDGDAGSDAELYDYTDRGAAGVHYAACGQSFEAWADAVLRGLDLTYLTQTLMRTNRVVTFDVGYAFHEDAEEAEVTVSGVDVEVAKESGDVETFVSEREIPDVTFGDVYGAEEAKKEMRGVVDVLKNSKKYRRLGIRLPRGILLDGPPGTGKTMLAKALARESGLQFMQRNAAEFVSMYAGEGAKRVRESFAAARKYAPCILFIDEVDAIARKRMYDVSQGTSDVLNALLSEMDGFEDHALSPVFVVAATNFDADKGAGQLDEAFLRRFDRKIRIDLPDFAVRKQYLTDCLEKYGSEVSERTVSSIAKRSLGWSLAELDVVLQNAVRGAQQGGGAVTDEGLSEAFEVYADGARKKYDAKKVEKTACHEAGHAVAAYALGCTPSFATVKARGNYGGYVYYGDEEVTELSREELLARVCILLAGRAAETERYGAAGVTTGAASDLKAATENVYRYLCDYGMDDELFLYVDPETARDSDSIRRKAIALMREQYARAQSIVRQYAEQVEAVARALIERDSLDETELLELLRERRESC